MKLGMRFWRGLSVVGFVLGSVIFGTLLAGLPAGVGYAQTASSISVEGNRRVEAGIVKSKAARAQSEASAHAAELAADRYSAGAATQLDVTQAQRDAFLAEASAVLARSLDYEATVRRVAQLLVPPVADWCGIDIVDPDGGSRQITSDRLAPSPESVMA